MVGDLQRRQHTMLSGPNLSLPVARTVQAQQVPTAVEAPNSTRGPGWYPKSSVALGITITPEADR